MAYGLYTGFTAVAGIIFALILLAKLFGVVGIPMFAYI
jgi:hypothetical protein